MRHQDLTINHRLESWVYADAAARTGATGFVSGDVGRIAYQTDTGEYWRLIATTPTWQRLAIAILPTGGTAGQLLAKNSSSNYDAGWKTPAALQTTGMNPGGITSTTGVMTGLGAATLLTPQVTGRILVAFNGSMSNSGTGGVQIVGIRWGTGAPPATNAALVGTALGGALGMNPTVAATSYPLSIQGVITGAPVGTQIWMDIVTRAFSAGTVTIANICGSAHEF